MTAWLDQVAAELLDVEQDVRRALRSQSRGGPAEQETRAARAGWRRLVMSAHEARALLRGAMPGQIARSRLREPHARVVVALELFGAHLVACNDPLHRPEAALSAAADLTDALERWQRVVRWLQASRAARVKWPVPRDITAIMRRQTPEQTFRGDLPAVVPIHARPRAAIRLVWGLADRFQGDLALPSPPIAGDVRQLVFPFPFLEAHHGASSAVA